MRTTIETVEMQLRTLGRELIPYPIRRHLWYQYEMAKKVLATRRFDLSAAVQIEVNTDCNRRCSYCPNSRSPKNPEHMDEKLFQQIIDELREINYRGRILPHCVNEPLLHPQLPQLIARAREVKKARIVVFTNGDFLNQARFDELRRTGVDAFVITQHGKNVPRALQDLLENSDSNKQGVIIYRNLNNFRLFNRGIPGLIEPNRRAIPNHCFLADCYIQILANGNVAQCCNDFSGEHVFGNVTQKPIMEIWNSPTFKAFRKEVKHGRFESELCRRCVFDTALALQGEALEARQF